MSAAGWYWALLPTVWLTAWWVCIIAVHTYLKAHRNQP